MGDAKRNESPSERFQPPKVHPADVKVDGVIHRFFGGYKMSSHGP